MASKKLTNSLRKFNKKKEDKPILFSGELGIPLNGANVVEVPGRDGFVFVRLKGNTSELIQAYNAVVSPVYGLPVLIGRRDNVYQVIGRNLSRYQNWGSAPYLPRHGFQHSFNPRLNIGGDTTWVYSQQFMPLLSYPSGSQGGTMLGIEPYFYEYGGTWRYAQVTGTPDYAAYTPTTGSARMILSYIDPADNSVKLLGGGVFPATVTGSSEIAQYIPSPLDNTIPLAAVRLTTGTSSIGWQAIYDVREFFQVRKPSTPIGVLGTIPVYDEGIFRGTGTSLNFTGQGVTATGSAGMIIVDVPGIEGKDEGVFLGYPKTLNVVGDRLTSYMSGTTMEIKASPDPQELIGVYSLDDGAVVGTGTTINWQNNITAVLSGTVLYVDVIGGGGGGGSGMGIMGLDDGVPLGTGTVMNFTGPGVQASISGVHINVDVVRDGWVLVDEIELSHTGTIIFNNISNIYSQLKVTGLAKTNYNASVDELNLRMGSGSVIDSSSSYGYITRWHGTSEATNSDYDHTAVARMKTAGLTANPGVYGYFLYIIEGYSKGRWKHVQCDSGIMASDDISVNEGYGVWRNNAIVNVVQVSPDGGTLMLSGSYARLYGMWQP